MHRTARRRPCVSARRRSTDAGACTQANALATRAAESDWPGEWPARLASRIAEPTATRLQHRGLQVRVPPPLTPLEQPKPAPTRPVSASLGSTTNRGDV